MNAIADDFGFHENPQVREVECEKHGTFEAENVFRNIWTTCPSCMADARAADAVKAEAKRKAEEVERWERRIGMAGIPERFRDRTLASYAAKSKGQEAALAFAQGYAREFKANAETGRSAVFVGLPGTGKTHLAIGIALDVMGQGYSALFTTTMRALRRIKETWSRDSEETEREAIAALTYPSLLILDEVGVQFGSDTEKLILFDVLNERYEQRKPTLLLSNLTADEVRGYLGDRIFDRLREDGGQVVVFDWESYRGKATP